MALDPSLRSGDKQAMSSQPIARQASSGLIRHICVYCGSATGADAVYVNAAASLGCAMAKAGVGLVYGGGGNGLMGTIARTVLENGGHVTGVIPDFLLNNEKLLPDIQESIVVPDMHTRKRMMFERADAFVALPGGIGTLEELVEQLTWVQLERHSKPVVIADVGGFWQPLLHLLAHMRQHRFIQSSFEVRYLVAEKIEDVLPMIEIAAVRTEVRGLRKDTVDPRL
jgi:uncharacterized protein (TIGR00730 family)